MGFMRRLARRGRSRKAALGAGAGRPGRSRRRRGRGIRGVASGLLGRGAPGQGGNAGNVLKRMYAGKPVRRVPPRGIRATGAGGAGGLGAMVKQYRASQGRQPPGMTRGPQGRGTQLTRSGAQPSMRNFLMQGAGSPGTRGRMRARPRAGYTPPPQGFGEGFGEGGTVMPSKSPKQARLMRAVAHGWKPSRMKGPPVGVAKEYMRADMAKKRKRMQMGGLAQAIAPKGNPIGADAAGRPGVPPSLRGYLQTLRSQRKQGNPGGRIGMGDQQGALARAMQTQTGRPPISRRAPFPGRAR